MLVAKLRVLLAQFVNPPPSPDFFGGEYRKGAFFRCFLHSFLVGCLLDDLRGYLFGSLCCGARFSLYKTNTLPTPIVVLPVLSIY